nr:2-phosphosulfolactate phosphatase [Thermus albus]
MPQPGSYPGTAIVVDVIRATTTAALYLRAGAKALVLAPGVEVARSLRQDGEILAGEVGGLPPEGFDLGNSPREVEGVAGKTVVMATTNGTRAAHAALGARHILLGSLQNAQAVAEVAAGSGGEVAIVCAGKEGNIALDDLYTAGVIGRRLQALGFAPEGEMAHLALFWRRTLLCRCSLPARRPRPWWRWGLGRMWRSALGWMPMGWSPASWGCGGKVWCLGYRRRDAGHFAGGFAGEGPGGGGL